MLVIWKEARFYRRTAAWHAAFFAVGDGWIMFNGGTLIEKVILEIRCGRGQDGLQDGDSDEP
jgi:hypothetical protein